MAHIVLIGDSILDNTAYVPLGEDVISRLKKQLPQGWQATSLAKDGSTVEDVYRQLSLIPNDATHVVLSAGGNDALMVSDILTKPATSVAEVLNKLADIGEQFENNYLSLLRAVRNKGLRTIVCTIYYPNIQDAFTQRLACTALTVFNDAIIRAVFDNSMILIDLRLLCNEARDYANEIEPSSSGSKKIAEMIFSVVSRHPWKVFTEMS
jgi:lysophospholipase L1-like esterase